MPIVNQVPPGNSGSRARRSTAPLNDSGSRNPVPILPFLVWPAAIHLPVGLLLSPIREAIRKPVATGRDRGSPPRGAKTYEGEPETCVINSSAVRIIYRKPIGFKGGWRFNGEKDSLFARTEGSV